MNTIILLLGSVLMVASISYLIYSLKIKYIRNIFIEKAAEFEKNYSKQKKNLFKDFINYMIDVMKIFNVNMYFSFDNFKQNMNYHIIGTDIFLTEGVVVEKKYISKDEIVNNIVDKVKDNVFINSSDNTVKDYYIVKFISKHNSKEYVINNKLLYDNIDISDIIFLTIVDNEVHNIGFINKQG